MFTRVLKKRSNNEEEQSYWISFSDLMASILIIFMLLFIYKILDYQEGIEQKEEMIQQISSTRIKIISMLQEKFEKENIDIVIDPKTGTIQLAEGILFDNNQNELKEEGKEFLGKFIPIYINILLGEEEIQKEISQIIIEGHTDDVGGYIYNLELSQQRAFNVAKFLLQDEIQYEQKEDFKKFITANGRSYSQPIENKNGQIDKGKSRRVEIEFRLKEEEALMQIQKELEKGIE